MTEAKIEVYHYSDELKRVWWLLLVSGIVSIGIGGFLIVSPKATIAVITAVIGLFMIITGIIRFLVALFDREAAERMLILFVGIAGVVLGVVVMKNPEATIVIIVLVVAIYWLISGLVDFARGISNSDAPDRMLRITFGLMSVLFGIVILLWPGVTIGVFAVVSGIYAVFFGILEVLAAFQLKNA